MVAIWTLDNVTQTPHSVYLKRYAGICKMLEIGNGAKIVFNNKSFRPWVANQSEIKGHISYC